MRGRVGLGLVAALSVLAGMTDAIGLLALGDFVSFMSGNTTRLAVAISEADLALVLRQWRRTGLRRGQCAGRADGAWLAPSGLAGAAGGCRTAGVRGSVAVAGHLPGAVGRHAGHGHDQCGGRTGEWPAHRPDLRDRRPVAFRPWPGALAAGRAAQRLAGAAGALGRHAAGGCARRLVATTPGPAGLAGSCALACMLALVSRFIPRAWQRGYMPR
jgi:hypothetical protein